jgi:hypothetical protein
LGGSIKDNDGFALNSDVEIEFRTETELYLSGSLIDDFEDDGNWESPNSNAFSQNIDTLFTDYQISSERQYSGGSSGKLTYKFLSNSGRAVLYNSSEPAIGTVSDSKFGIWIFGDLSGNKIEFWFKDDQSTIIETETAIIDWTGWKLISYNLNNIPSSGDISLHSLAIEAETSGSDSGIVFFDDMQNELLTDIEDPGIKENISYLLDQNYPNPFNPSTTIKYTIPEPGYVELKMFDILGNEIATLIDEYKNAGSYKIVINSDDSSKLGRQLASGIYIYSIRVNDFRSSKKMVLLK